MHVFGLALAGWATHGAQQPPAPVPVLHTTRLYPMHYQVQERPKARPEARPVRRPVDQVAVAAESDAPTAPPPSMPVISAPVPVSETTSEPVQPSPQVHELAPGQVAGVGQVMESPNAAASEGGLLGKLGFRVPVPGELGPPTGGVDRVAELLRGARSACPELRTPESWAKRSIAVAVAFVVDTNGKVDQRTLRVIESPNRPAIEQRFHAHIYVVGAKARPDGKHMDPAGYDSLVTHDVAQHVSTLAFRPALKQGQPVPSTVLIACEASPNAR